MHRGLCVRNDMRSQAYFFDQRAPVAGVKTEKLFMLHIQLVYDGIFKIPVVSFKVFFTHLFGIEHMDLGLAVFDVLGQRRCQIRSELVFQAFLCDEAHVVFIPAGHDNKGAVIGVGHLAFEALLHEPGAVLPGVDEAVYRLYH